MTVLGMPTSMFLVFVATILAGSLGAMHFVVWHVILGKPFGDEDLQLRRRDPGAPTAGGRRAARAAEAADR